MDRYWKRDVILKRPEGKAKEESLKIWEQNPITKNNACEVYHKFPFTKTDVPKFFDDLDKDPEFKKHQAQAESRVDVEPPRGSGKTGKSLTLYWADWCPHCHDMMPEWQKLGASYKGIKLFAVEEKQNKSFKVDGYPTIIYRDGKRIEKYEGPRNKSGFVSFLKNKLGKA